MKCPNMISNPNSIDYCKETDSAAGMKPCLLMFCNECEEWESIKKEWEDESK